MNHATLIIYNASAGSGKTTTLVREILKIILSGNEIAIREVLGMTFTNAVANELKKRMVEVLYDVAFNSNKFNELKNKYFENISLSKEDIEKKCKNALIYILHHYTDLSLQTIDSFFNRILKGFAKELNYSVAYEITPDADEYYKRATDKYLENINDKNDYFNKLYDYIIQQKRDDKETYHINHLLSELIFTLKNLSEKEIDLEKIKHQKELLQKINQKEIQSTIQFQKKQFETSKARFEQEIREYIEKIGEENKYYFVENGELKKYNNSSIYGNRLRTLSSIYKNPFDNLNEDKFNNDWFGKNGRKEDEEKIRSIYENFKGKHNALLQYQQDINILKSITNKVVITKIALELLEILLNIKSEEDIVFFSDFTKQISALIQNEPAEFIFERVGTRYKHFLIDEFQDTSELQFITILPLIHNSMATGHQNFIVGDPKQSIYGWRNANVEQFIHLYHQKKFPESINDTLKNDLKNFENLIESKKLEYNFRSAKDIVEFNNLIFDNLEFNGFPLIQEAYLDAKQIPTNNKNGYVEIIEYEAAGKLNNKEQRFQQFCEDVLERINECIQSGYKQRDICIILRRNNDIFNLIQELKDKKLSNDETLKFISPEGLLIYQSEEVSFIISFLKLLVNKNDKIADAVCYRYLHPNKEFTKNQIGFIDKMLHQGETEKDIEKSEQFKELFASYELSKYSIYQVCLNIIQYFNIPLTNEVQKLLEIVHQFVFTYADRGNTIFDFLNFWEENHTSFSISVSANENAVQIMTIHKSKGLEFPVVIFNLDFQHDSNNYWFELPEDTEFKIPSTPIYNEQQQIISDFKKILLYLNPDEISYFDEDTGNKLIEKEHLENINLIYVACTRAIDRMYIFSTSKNDYYKNIFHQKIQSFIEKPENSNDTEEKKITIYHYGNKITQPTHQTSSTSQKYIDLSDITLCNNQNILLANTSNPYSDEHIELGIKIHKILEFVNDNNINYAVKKALAKGIIHHNEKETIIQMLKSLVNNELLKQYFQPENIQQVFNEVSIFSSENTFRPDKIIISKQNEVVVLEFKTGKERKKYHQQIKNYIQLLQNIYNQNNYTYKAFLVYINNENLLAVENVEV